MKENYEIPRHFSPLSNTINMMISDDYKERFCAEYLQLDIRIKSLASMLTKYHEGTLGFEPTCKIELLEEQLKHMWRYRECLIKRAGIENISLEEIYYD